MHHQYRSDEPSTTAAERGLSTTTTVVDGGYGGRTSGEIMISRSITRHQYGQDNILQSYDVYIPDHGQGPEAAVTTTDAMADDEGGEDGQRKEKEKYWVLFIHGGYFRDANVCSTSFIPALSKIALSSSTTAPTSSVSSSIAGYASINYRLSPHPNDPQDPTTTSTYELRDAKWPEHMHDVLAAIAHLQHKHRFGNRYLLVGHSVGATMALLATLSSDPSDSSSSSFASSVVKIDPPLAVLGVSGIYDFPALHARFPSYVALTRNAKIATTMDDVRASPARYDLGRYETEWASNVPGGKVGVVLAHSRNDGLVDWGQVEIMNDVLTNSTTTTTVSDGKDRAGKRQGHGGKGEGKAQVEVNVLEIYGQHSQIWRDGTELARAIGEGVEMMKRLTPSH